ncbi:hypothetical protein F5Y03DRAFT_341305 [Xylaria venustula]|nr:hypothetical protein F5Y03DRAFT_341305 [Xylaria venustula]
MPEARPDNILTIPLGEFGIEGIDKFAQHMIAGQIHHFIQCSETCALHHINPSAVLPPERASIELQPVSLPAEIILCIIQNLEGPYKLQGSISDVFPGIVFCRPRLWSHMPAFQICHTTRAQAIKRYGTPSLRSLPFDASVDSISLRHRKFMPPIHYGLDSRRDNPDGEELFVLDSLFKLIEEVMPTEFPEPRFCLFYGTVRERSTRVTNPGKPLRNDFFDKTQFVEIETGGGQYFDVPEIEWEWDWIASYLEKFKSIRKLKIKLVQTDACCVPASERSSDFQGGRFYNGTDIVMLSNFLNDPYLVYSLETFEIEKMKPHCGKNLKSLLWSKNRSTMRKLLFGPLDMAARFAFDGNGTAARAD